MKLVLLPGLDGTGVLFRPFLAALPPDIEPVVVSYPTQKPLGYGELLSLVQAKIPMHEPFALLGESFGGPLALRVAAARPQGLQAVILCGSFVSCPFAFVPKWASKLVSSWPFHAFPLFAKCKGRLGLYASKEHLALSIEALTQVAPGVFAERVRQIIHIDVAAELRDCTAPILYLQGKRDGVVWRSNLRRIVELKPDVQSAVIDSSHMILKTEPAAAARVILEFMRRVHQA